MTNAPHDFHLQILKGRPAYRCSRCQVLVTDGLHIPLATHPCLGHHPLNPIDTDQKTGLAVLVETAPGIAVLGPASYLKLHNEAAP